MCLGNQPLKITNREKLHFRFIHLKDKRKKYEPPVPTRVGKKQKKLKGPEAANKLPLGKYDSCSLLVYPVSPEPTLSNTT
jgi:hypothetical protein